MSGPGIGAQRAPSPSRPGPVPLCVLTGWLGAGKTTVLNRLLAAPGGRRIAVLVNELGRIDIDRHLIRAHRGDLIELSGGCVCCQVDVQGELWESMRDLVERTAPDHLVLETTGIALPQGLFAGWSALPAQGRPGVALRSVVAVFDAECGADTLARHEEARAQLEAADRVLLSKLDIASPERTVAVHAHLGALAPDTERAAFPATAEADGALVPWLLAPGRGAGVSTDLSSVRGAPSPPHRHGQIAAATYVDDAPLLGAPLLATLEALGPRLLRAKGFVHLFGNARRAFLEKAGARLTLRDDAPWPEGRRDSEIVLIGEGLDEGELRRRLWACRAGG